MGPPWLPFSLPWCPVCCHFTAFGDKWRTQKISSHVFQDRNIKFTTVHGTETRGDMVWRPLRATYHGPEWLSFEVISGNVRNILRPGIKLLIALMRCHHQYDAVFWSTLKYCLTNNDTHAPEGLHTACSNKSKNNQTHIFLPKLNH